MKNCPKCHGVGTAKSGRECLACKGVGQVSEKRFKELEKVLKRVYTMNNKKSNWVIV